MAALYAATGLTIAIGAGWVIGRLQLEHHIEDWVQQMTTVGDNPVENRLTLWDRLVYGKDAVVATGILFVGFSFNAFMG